MKDSKEENFRKSSFSQYNRHCVEASIAKNNIVLRNSKDASGPRLKFTEQEWGAFINGVKNGEFDI